MTAAVLLPPPSLASPPLTMGKQQTEKQTASRRERRKGKKKERTTRRYAAFSPPSLSLRYKISTPLTSSPSPSIEKTAPLSGGGRRARDPGSRSCKLRGEPEVSLGGKGGWRGGGRGTNRIRTRGSERASRGRRGRGWCRGCVERTGRGGRDARGAKRVEEMRRRMEFSFASLRSGLLERGDARVDGVTSATNDALLVLQSETGQYRKGGIRGRRTHEGEDHDGVREGTETGDVKGLEGEGLLALEGVQQLETLKTGRLLEVGRDLSRLTSGTCLQPPPERQSSCS